jgi:hypothetical protein
VAAPGTSVDRFDLHHNGLWKQIGAGVSYSSDSALLYCVERGHMSAMNTIHSASVLRRFPGPDFDVASTKQTWARTP